MKKVLVTLLLTLLLSALCLTAMAQIRCTCGLDDCICFIQYGDKGLAVSGIIDLLYDHGYLKSHVGALYTERVEEAVMAFQKDHDIKVDGKITDNTLTWLLYDMSITELDRRYPDSDGQTVWVSTDGGTKYHSYAECSGMAYARKVSARNAEALGFEPCSRCWIFGK